MRWRYGRGMTHPQVWFITGAARGIGRALAVAALDAGDVQAAAEHLVSRRYFQRFMDEAEAHG